MDKGLKKSIKYLIDTCNRCLIGSKTLEDVEEHSKVLSEEIYYHLMDLRAKRVLKEERPKLPAHKLKPQCK